MSVPPHADKSGETGDAGFESQVDVLTSAAIELILDSVEPQYRGRHFFIVQFAENSEFSVAFLRQMSDSKCSFNAQPKAPALS
jgi:hypothetical protein